MIRPTRGDATAKLNNDRQRSRTWGSAMERVRRAAWLLILIADVGLLAWGAMAALARTRLLGPDSMPIVLRGTRATRASWSALADTPTADFITLVFRMFGVGNVEFALMGIAISATAFRSGDSWAGGRCLSATRSLMAPR